MKEQKMSQEKIETTKVEKDLCTLAVGETIVYGFVNRQGVSSVDTSVKTVIRTLESSQRIMLFQRKMNRFHEYELIAMGTTRELNDRIFSIVKRYEEHMAIIKKLDRS
jgi:hypothetical protein